MPDVKGETLGKLATPLGYDGTDVRPFRIDIDGTLQVKVGTSALPAGGSTLAGQTIIADAVKKLLGYSLAVLNERVIDANAAAGGNTLKFTSPTGTEGWVIQMMCAYNNTSACTQVQVGLKIGGIKYPLARVHAPGAGVIALWNGELFIDSTVMPFADFTGCILNDTIVAYLIGHERTA